MKPFKFACPACGKNYAIRKLEQVGRKMRCTGCQSVSAITRTPMTAAAEHASTRGRDLVNQLSELTGMLESASAELSTFSASPYCPPGSDDSRGGAAVAVASPRIAGTAPISPAA